MPATEYTWDPVTDSILEETDGAGSVLASYTNEPSDYGPLISQDRNGESRYFHFDALGSTRELTDDEENVTDTFAYDAWGNMVEHTGTTSISNQWLALICFSTNIQLGTVASRRRVLSPSNARWFSGRQASGGYLFRNNRPANDTNINELLNIDISSHIDVDTEMDFDSAGIVFERVGQSFSTRILSKQGGCQCTGGCWLSCPTAPTYCNFLSVFGNGCCSTAQIARVKSACGRKSNACPSLCSCYPKSRNSPHGGVWYNCAAQSWECACPLPKSPAASKCQYPNQRANKDECKRMACGFNLRGNPPCNIYCEVVNL